MAIYSKIRGLHVYERDSGKVEPGDIVSLSVDPKWMENKGEISVMVFNLRGKLCGHIAVEDADTVGRMLVSGAVLQAGLGM
jgi:hypothetical protein